MARSLNPNGMAEPLAMVRQRETWESWVVRVAVMPGMSLSWS